MILWNGWLYLHASRNAFALQKLRKNLDFTKNTSRKLHLKKCPAGFKESSSQYFGPGFWSCTYFPEYPRFTQLEHFTSTTLNWTYCSLVAEIWCFRSLPWDFNNKWTGSLAWTTFIASSNNGGIFGPTWRYKHVNESNGSIRISSEFLAPTPWA